MLKKLLEKVLHAPKPSAGMFNEVGAIILDDTPLVEVVPLAGGHPSMREALDEFFRNESFRRAQQQLGLETYEEALDFGPEDETHPGSPYSLEDERVVYEANARLSAAKAAHMAAAEAGEEPPVLEVAKPRRAAPEPLKRAAKPVQSDVEDDA